MKMSPHGNEEIKSLAREIAANGHYDVELVEKILRTTLSTNAVDGLDDIKYKLSLGKKIKDLGIFGAAILGALSSIIAAFVL